MGNYLFANIIVDLNTSALNKCFIFKIPEELKKDIHQGSKVIFPFGKGNTDREGYVIEVLTYEQLKNKKFYKNDEYFKNIDAIDNLKFIKSLSSSKIGLTEILLKIAIFLCKEYFCPLNICINTVLPIKKIVKKNSRQIDAIKKYDLGSIEKNDIVLNEEQQKVVDDIVSDYKSGTFTEHLINGVTGAGKTEVYLRIIERVLKDNKTAIVMIPEIALTNQTVMRLKQKFGEKVAIIHSKMSNGDKYIQYNKCMTGEATILVGPRSAVFAPFDNLGIIVIDEENDSAYKSETNPKYDTIEVARFRCKEQNAVLCLLSATPHIDVYYRAINNDNIKIHYLTKRASSEKPEVHIVDMKDEVKHDNKTLFSKLLTEKINERLEKKEQVMLYMNRRGFDTIITCKNCGETLKCPHCDVSLVSHNDGTLKCHYCDYEIKEPLLCPKCNSLDLEKYGIGTEKLEEMCISIFPTAKVIRMDRDTTKGKDGYDKIIEKFRSGAADILIGTQMIVKGHDFPNVTLVCVMMADLALFANNYKAAENTFSMLTQCIGRSGRKKIGESIIQTYNPTNEVIRFSAIQDYRAFFDHEIIFRKKLLYPPFSKILYIKLSSAFVDDVTIYSQNLKLLITTKNIYGATILGPTNAHPFKVKDIYSMYIYVKCKNIKDAKFFRNIAYKYIDYINKQKSLKIDFDIE